MKNQKELERGIYFFHGQYMEGNENTNARNLVRNHAILMKDSMEQPYTVEAYDIDIGEILIDPSITQGDFVYYDGQSLYRAENDLTVRMYEELNRQLRNTIGYLNYGNKPEELKGYAEQVYSFHVNVGHGNCSIIVFSNQEKWNAWMVDCSVFDFTNKSNYRNNLNDCLVMIRTIYGINRISKLLVTHLHYDHINGIEHLIKQGWIDENTEVWMNIQYPWKQPTYNRILSLLNSQGVKFVDPIVGNSTNEIKILYPDISFNERNPAPKKNINNASVLYQICLGGKRMLFTGDIETEGWDMVSMCKPFLKRSTYYCISHHGSITGHLRNNCIFSTSVNMLSDCAARTKIQILMGRDNAYRGVYSSRVLTDFKNIIKVEKASKYVRIEWATGNVKWS